MASVTFEVKYKAGHSYSETWEETELYCPCCGSQRVWVEGAPGDYYTGPRYLCLACTGLFSLPHASFPTPDEPHHAPLSYDDRQRLNAIAEALRSNDG